MTPIPIRIKRVKYLKINNVNDGIISACEEGAGNACALYCYFTKQRSSKNDINSNMTSVFLTAGKINYKI